MTNRLSLSYHCHPDNSALVDSDNIQAEQNSHLLGDLVGASDNEHRWFLARHFLFISDQLSIRKNPCLNIIGKF